MVAMRAPLNEEFGHTTIPMKVAYVALDLFAYRFVEPMNRKKYLVIIDTHSKGICHHLIYLHNSDRNSRSRFCMVLEMTVSMAHVS